mgnify:FL=1
MKKRKKEQVYCHCGAKATLRPCSYVYGAKAKTNGYLYVCDRYPECDSYVGAHQKTLKPMGSLANGDLRYERILAHKAFDWIWQSGLMSRRDAYLWLEVKLGVGHNQAHIAMLSEFMCDRLITICSQMQKQRHKAA